MARGWVSGALMLALELAGCRRREAHAPPPPAQCRFERRLALAATCTADRVWKTEEIATSRCDDGSLSHDTKVRPTEEPCEPGTQPSIKLLERLMSYNYSAWQPLTACKVVSSGVLFLRGPCVHGSRNPFHIGWEGCPGVAVRSVWKKPPAMLMIPCRETGPVAEPDPNGR
jgi:hypothetical protein